MEDCVTANTSKCTQWTDHNQILEVTFDSMSSPALALCEFKTTAETLTHRHRLLGKTINVLHLTQS